MPTLPAPVFAAACTAVAAIGSPASAFSSPSEATTKGGASSNNDTSLSKLLSALVSLACAPACNPEAASAAASALGVLVNKVAGEVDATVCEVLDGPSGLLSRASGRSTTGWDSTMGGGGTSRPMHALALVCRALAMRGHPRAMEPVDMALRVLRPGGPRAGPRSDGPLKGGQQEHQQDQDDDVVSVEMAAAGLFSTLVEAEPSLLLRRAPPLIKGMWQQRTFSQSLQRILGALQSTAVAEPLPLSAAAAAAGPLPLSAAAEPLPHSAAAAEPLPHSAAATEPLPQPGRQQGGCDAAPLLGTTSAPDSIGLHLALCHLLMVCPPQLYRPEATRVAPALVAALEALSQPAAITATAATDGAGRGDEAQCPVLITAAGGNGGRRSSAAAVQRAGAVLGALRVVRTLLLPEAPQHASAAGGRKVIAAGGGDEAGPMTEHAGRLVASLCRLVGAADTCTPTSRLVGGASDTGAPTTADTREAALGCLSAVAEGMPYRLLHPHRPLVSACPGVREDEPQSPFPSRISLAALRRC